MENENENKIISPFSFLEEEKVQIYFADLNKNLLESAHIDSQDYYSYNLLERYYHQLDNYYRQLYRLKLEKDKNDNQTYYYLDYLSVEEKGGYSNYIELSALSSIVGMLLLTIYHDKFFENIKVLKWEELESLILESRDSDLHKKIWFGSIRDEYSDKEWLNLYRKLHKPLLKFKKMRWIKSNLPPANASIEEVLSLEVTINPSFNRFAKIYENEIEQFDSFYTNYLENKKAK